MNRLDLAHVIRDEEEDSYGVVRLDCGCALIWRCHGCCDEGICVDPALHFAMSLMDMERDRYCGKPGPPEVGQLLLFGEPDGDWCEWPEVARKAREQQEELALAMSGYTLFSDPWEKWAEETCAQLGID